MSDRDLFCQYFPDVSRETLDDLQIYADTLVKWQKQINLVGPKTISELWLRHMVDSAQVHYKVNEILGSNSNRRWLDFGAGAGFPSLVLSIMGGGHVYPCESVGKKCSFMRTIMRDTSAKGEVKQGRIEDLDPFPVDIITSRALATIDLLLNYSEKFLSEDVELWLLKGRNWQHEVDEAKQHWVFHVEHFTSVVEDGIRLASEEDTEFEKLKTPRQIPFVGWAIYNFFQGGLEKYNERQERKRYE